MNESQAEELLDLLRDTRGLMQLAMRDRLEEIREELFGDDDDQKEAFRLFCGGESYRDIGEEVGVSHTTVSRWVTTWRSAGLVHASRKRAIVSPEMLGINLREENSDER